MAKDIWIKEYKLLDDAADELASIVYLAETANKMIVEAALKYKAGLWKVEVMLTDTQLHLFEQGEDVD